jgi:hypothetical protein
MATALTAAAIVTAGGGAAGAAEALNAQSVGRFLDGSAGGQPIQSIVDLKDARATAPGTQSTQNPLEADLGGQVPVDLTGKLQLPSNGLGEFGAVNQVAVAKTDGYSYGASGAVSNSGGVSVGGNNSKYPSSASITLDATSFQDSSPVTIPGGGDSTAAALGGLTASVTGVAALAKTKVGGDAVTPVYSIADLTLGLQSPLVGQLLGQVTGALSTGLGTLLTTATGGQVTLPAACTFAAFSSEISLEGGAVTIDPTTGAITISVAGLLDQAGLDLNNLPANTDLLSYILNYLSSPSGLAQSLSDLIGGLTGTGNTFLAKFTACGTAITGDSSLANLATALTSQLNTAKTSFQTQVTSTVNGLASQAGASPLAPLADGIANVLDIGVNIESGPGKAADNKDAPYTSKLKATPDQATAVVKGQTLVRAIEIDILNAAQQAPTPNSASHRQIAGKAVAGRPLAQAAAGDPAAVLALANAAVGPSAAAAPTTAATTAAGSDLPTGVPAGQGTPHHGTPILPLLLVLLGVVLAGGATVVVRKRGTAAH